MKKTLILMAFALVIILGTQTLSAQASVEDLNSALGFDNTVADVPESPIHFLVWLGMLVGAYLGFKKLK